MNKYILSNSLDMGFVFAENHYRKTDIIEDEAVEWLREHAAEFTPMATRHIDSFSDIYTRFNLNLPLPDLARPAWTQEKDGEILFFRILGKYTTRFILWKRVWMPEMTATWL